jgi:hypothetical protein
VTFFWLLLFSVRGTKTYFSLSRGKIDGQKYARSLYFNIKFRVLEIVRYICRKEGCHKAAHSTVGEEHKKYV